jgi:hypothetical protein
MPENLTGTFQESFAVLLLRPSILPPPHPLPASRRGPLRVCMNTFIYSKLARTITETETKRGPVSGARIGPTNGARLAFDNNTPYSTDPPWIIILHPFSAPKLAPASAQNIDQPAT